MYKFIYFWLHWVLVAVHRPPPAAVSGGHSLPRCAVPSLRWPLPLRSTGSRRVGFSSCGSWASAVAARGLQQPWLAASRAQASVVVAHGLSCSAACGMFLDQGSNPCPLHWQADSQPLCHQGNPKDAFLTNKPT